MSLLLSMFELLYLLITTEIEKLVSLVSIIIYSRRIHIISTFTSCDRLLRFEFSDFSPFWGVYCGVLVLWLSIADV